MAELRRSSILGATIARRRPFGWIAGSALALRVLLGGILMPQLAEANGDLVVDVAVDLSTSEVSGSAAGGPGAFIVLGTINPEGGIGSADPIGEFACWGFIPISALITPGVADTARVPISQHCGFHNGDIQVQGYEDFKGQLSGLFPESNGLRAVVGGSGGFRNFRGDAWFALLPDPGAFQFRATFHGVGRGGHDDVDE